MFIIALVLSISVFVSSAQAELYTCLGLPSQSNQLAKPQPASDPCTERETSIVALTQTGVVYLCEAGKSIGHFDISLGRGGVGKTQNGDLKTPLGTYSLSFARPSERFGLFIPVGYPTTEQSARGFTGGSVGIHGPDRHFACAGLLNVSFNWTQGCLAVASDASIQKIAGFLRAHPNGRRIHILK